MSNNICAEDLRAAPGPHIKQMEAHLQSRLAGYVRNLRLDIQDGGLILRGSAHTYFTPSNSPSKP